MMVLSGTEKIRVRKNVWGSVILAKRRSCLRVSCVLRRQISSTGSGKPIQWRRVATVRNAETIRARAHSETDTTSDRTA